MNFDSLKRRVERAEQLVDGRIAQTAGHKASLVQRWRDAWTPSRIVIAGLLGGVLVAKARPLRTLGAVSGTRWIQLATSLSGLVASLKAAQAAESAETAASGAEDAAEDAADTVEAATGDEAGARLQPQETQASDDAAPRAVPDGRRRRDAQWESEPRPAEAATELSER